MAGQTTADFRAKVAALAADPGRTDDEVFELAQDIAINVISSRAKGKGTRPERLARMRQTLRERQSQP